MNKIMTFARPLFTVLFALSLTVSALADTVRLKDGSIIKGRIVSFGSGRFTVAVGEGSRQRQMTFTADEVESIQFDEPSAKTSVGSTEDPRYIQTSTPPKSVPRVVKTDTTASNPEPARVIQRPPVAETPNSAPPVVESSRTGTAKPIEVSVKVLADSTSNGWTNSGWVVRKGQKIRVIGGGSISIGNGKSTGPSGLYDTEDPEKLLKSVPTGALIAVIGDDNNEFIYIGSERTFTASRDGALFLGVNEANLDDNSGSFEVRIEIEPA